MKRAGRIYRWIIISVLCQVILLVFLNNVYLARRGEATATLVETKEEKPKNNLKVEIPQNASKVRVSYDNSFAAYMLDGKLEIMHLSDKKVVKTIQYAQDEITLYRWLPDRNMVIYAIKAPDSQAGKVQVVTYNMDSEVEHAYPKITGVPAKSEITDIELSPLTNVVYAKVTTGSTSAKIYKYDIMSELSFVMNTSDKMVMKEMNYDNKMIYQDDKNRLFVWDGLKASSKQLAYKERLALFAVVGLDDEVYAGELNGEGKVVKIRYGTVDQTVDKWNTVDLKTPVLPENVFITADGTVYERVEDKKLVYNLKNGEKITYEGNFVEIFSKHIVTRDGKTLKIDNIDGK